VKKEKRTVKVNKDSTYGKVLLKNFSSLTFEKVGTRDSSWTYLLMPYNIMANDREYTYTVEFLNKTFLNEKYLPTLKWTKTLLPSNVVMEVQTYLTTYCEDCFKH
jgi:hypothetical protein